MRIRGKFQRGCPSFIMITHKPRLGRCESRGESVCKPSRDCYEKYVHEWALHRTWEKTHKIIRRCPKIWPAEGSRGSSSKSVENLYEINVIIYTASIKTSDLGVKSIAWPLVLADYLNICEFYQCRESSLLARQVLLVGSRNVAVDWVGMPIGRCFRPR